MVPFRPRNQQPFNRFREILGSCPCHGPETLIRELPSLWALLSPFVAPPGLGGGFDKPESVHCLFRKDITLKRNCFFKQNNCRPSCFLLQMIVAAFFKRQTQPGRIPQLRKTSLMAPKSLTFTHSEFWRSLHHTESTQSHTFSFVSRT